MSHPHTARKRLQYLLIPAFLVFFRLILLYVMKTCD
jgi:hypothetical protein